MKHKDYWKQRFIQLENSQHGMTATAFAKIEAQYRAAQKEIEGQIALWYQRFADNNGISMAEARQWISGNALKELKWDVKEYIKYGKENALLGGAWMQELENASAKFHISKLEALKIHTQQSLEKLFSKQESTIAGLLGDVYKSGYYHTAYELQKGFGIGFDIAAVDQPYLEKVLAKPWAADGKNFSERVWGNKAKIIQEAHTELSRNILTGGDPQKAIDVLSKKFQTSKYNAGRLIQTEQAYFSSVAQKQCFEDLGVEEYEIVATLDSHTSDICQNLDGQHFPMKDFEAGVTAPPFHVNCRSTTAPYFSETFGQIGGRAARDAETGKTYYVPDDLKYADWKAAFVDGDKSGFDVSSVDGVTHYKHKEKDLPDEKGNDILFFMDITELWTSTAGNIGTVSELREYTVGGVTYEVDGKHVILRPTQQEKAVATVLSQKYGKTVEFVPQIMFPQGIQTPDYLIDGERFDLKSPTGRGKNLLYGAIAKQKRQAYSFIVDVTDCPLSMEELERQINDLYRSPRIGFLETLVLMRGGEVVKVYARK